jgi:hypothetical protein
MCCHVRSASVSRRCRPKRRQSAPQTPLAMLDLSKPAERQAHDFLCRATSKRDHMWKLIGLRRQGDVLLCVVRWVHPDSATKTFSLAEVSLKQIAVHWWYFASPEAAWAEMTRRSTASATSQGAAYASPPAK